MSRPDIEVVLASKLKRDAIRANLQLLEGEGHIEALEPTSKAPWVPRRSVVNGRAYRPGDQVYALTPDAGYALGIAISHDSLSVGVGPASGEMVGHVYESFDVDGKDINVTLSRAVKIGAELLPTSSVGSADLRGVGLVVAAALDRTKGTAASGILKGWGNRPLPKLLDLALKREGISVPFDRLCVDNIANAEALGQMRYGVTRGKGHSILVRIGSGVGVGIVSDRRVLRGAGGGAGELGHIVADLRGLISSADDIGVRDLDPQAVCPCGGVGHLEAYAGHRGIVGRVGDRLPSELVESTLDMTVAAIVRHAEAGDLVCQKTLDDVGELLGNAVVIAVDLLDPDVVALSGPVAGAVAPLVQARLQNSIRPVERATPAVVALRDDWRLSPAIGACAMVHAELPAVNRERALRAGFG